MAGIEKVCEYSGEGGGWEMYGYKRNSIQVLPEYRKEFSGKKMLLVFFPIPELRNYCGNPPKPFFPLFKKLWPAFWRRFYWQWRDVGMFYRRPSRVWSYCLYVPECPGRVKGRYWNDTTDPERTLTNLTRLCGRKGYLEVCPATDQEYTPEEQEERVEKIIEDYNKESK